MPTLDLSNVAALFWSDENSSVTEVAQLYAGSTLVWQNVPPIGGFRADLRGHSGRVTSATLTDLPLGNSDEADVWFVWTHYSAADQTSTPSATLGGQSGTRRGYGFDFNAGAQWALFEFTGVTGTLADFVLSNTGTVSFQDASIVSAREVDSQNFVFVESPPGDGERNIDQNLLEGDEVFAFGFGEGASANAWTVSNMTIQRNVDMTGAAGTRNVFAATHTATETQNPRTMRAANSDSGIYWPQAVSLRLRG